MDLIRIEIFAWIRIRKKNECASSTRLNSLSISFLYEMKCPAPLTDGDACYIYEKNTKRGNRKDGK
jgi:hypothetical protein